MGYVGLERFEAAGFWIRERGVLVKAMLGNDKAVCNWSNRDRQMRRNCMMRRSCVFVPLCIRDCLCKKESEKADK